MVDFNIFALILVVFTFGLGIRADVITVSSESIPKIMEETKWLDIERTSTSEVNMDSTPSEVARGLDIGYHSEIEADTKPEVGWSTNSGGSDNTNINSEVKETTNGNIKTEVDTTYIKTESDTIKTDDGQTEVHIEGNKIYIRYREGKH